MREYAKTAYSGILRDLSTNAIINTNDAEYNRILEQRRQNKNTQIVQQQIETLRSEFLELKEMLKQVLNGKA